MQYLKLDVLKAFLKDTSATNDSLYTLILDGVEQAVETYLGRGPLGRVAATEYYSPNGEREIVLDRYPLLTASDVASVYEDQSGRWGQNPDGSFATATLLTAGTDYAVRIDGVSKRASLVRVDVFWPYTRRQLVPENLSTGRAEAGGSVKVTYTAGWPTAAPADVVMACYGEAAARWKTTPFGFGVPTSESVDGASASITMFPVTPGKYGPFLTEGLARAVSQYRRIPVGA